ncbi:MAG: helix-turn-helix domain-containing protein [Candidatus Falkowbacteria bacterium]|nr:helix-turn-helix domain-containing protein [Candidatus Falkowbacteria bacterium]
MAKDKKNHKSSNFYQFDTISAEKAMEIFRMKSPKTLNAFARSMKLIRFSRDSDPLCRTVWETESVKKALGVQDLPEKFLVISEVAEILKVDERQIASLCRRGLLPYYKFNYNRGSHLLFIREEITSKLIIRLFLERPLDYYSTEWRYGKYEDLARNILDQARKKNVFSEKSYDIVTSLLFKTNTVENLSRKYQVSVKTIIRAFDAKFSTLATQIGSLHETNLNIKQENDRLSQENITLKEQLLNAKKCEYAKCKNLFSEGILDWRIEVTELPQGAKNCLDSAGIETIGQLISKTEHDLLKISSLGFRKLKQIEEYLLSNDLKLKKL